MTELIDVLDAFSTPLKIGWVVWLGWGVGQVVWYRHERRSAAAPKAAPAKSVPPSVLKRAARKPAPEPVVHRLITPEPTLDAPRPAVAQPAFDPATAVVETFGEPASDLDRFVADFERSHSRHAAH